MWKRTHASWKTLAACGLAALAVACGDGKKSGGETPDPNDPGTETPLAIFPSAAVGIAVTLDPASLEVTGDAAYTLTLTAAAAHLAAVRVDLPAAVECTAVSADVTDTPTADTVLGACADGALTFDVGSTVDLLDTATAGDLDDIGLPLGAYSGIELDLSPAAETETAELGAYSLVIYGSYVTETTTSVRFALTLDDALLVSSASAISLPEAGGEDLVATLDGESWLAAVTAEIESCLEATTTTFADLLDFDTAVAANAECDAVEDALIDTLPDALGLSLRPRD